MTAKKKTTVQKKKRKLKPKDFPKRPLSAYNIFFKETREVMLAEKEKEVGKDNIDFQSMVKEIAEKWKALTSEERERVTSLAKIDLQRYKDEVRVYEEVVARKKKEEAEEEELKKKKEEESGATATLSTTSVRGGGLGEQSSLAAALSTGGGSLGANARDLPPQQVEEMRRTLEEELRVIEAAREMKLRQLAELPGSGLSQLSHESEQRRLAGMSQTNYELEQLLRHRAAVSAGLGMPLPNIGDHLGMSAAGAGTIAQEEALLRSLQERELISAQLSQRAGGHEGLVGSYPPTRAGALAGEHIQLTKGEVPPSMGGLGYLSLLQNRQLQSAGASAGTYDMLRSIVSGNTAAAQHLGLGGDSSRSHER